MYARKPTSTPGLSSEDSPSLCRQRTLISAGYITRRWWTTIPQSTFWWASSKEAFKSSKSGIITMSHPSTISELIFSEKRKISWKSKKKNLLIRFSPSQQLLTSKWGKLVTKSSRSLDLQMSDTMSQKLYQKLQATLLPKSNDLHSTFSTLMTKKTTIMTWNLWGRRDQAIWWRWFQEERASMLSSKMKNGEIVSPVLWITLASWTL